MATTESYRVKKTDRNELQSWLRSRSVDRGLAERARIVLMSGDGMGVTEISGKLQVSRPTVYKWQQRYELEGVDGLHDQPRSGRPTNLTEAKIKRILHLTTERVPKEATHWSTRLMAKYASVTQWQVRQVWAAANLKPHRLKTLPRRLHQRHRASSGTASLREGAQRRVGQAVRLDAIGTGNNRGC